MRSKNTNHDALIVIGGCVSIAWVKATNTRSKCRNLEVCFAQFAHLPSSIRLRVEKLTVYQESIEVNNGRKVKSIVVESR